MPGLIAGLEMARRALLTHQSTLTVTGHNIANVATPGFTRRRAVLEPTLPEETPEGRLGSGVTFVGVERKRDVFIDSQVREERGLLGKWSARAESLLRVEGVINEPGENGLSELMNQFWNSWLDLSNQPEDLATRAVVVQKSDALIEGFRRQDDRIDAILEGSDRELEQLVERINTRLEELGELNGQIGTGSLQDGSYADLEDRRDLLIDELAELAGASHLVRADGQTVVRIGGRTVVQGSAVDLLASQRFSAENKVHSRVVFALDNGEPHNLSGRLGGLTEVREEVIPEFRQKLETLSLKLVESVNRLHAAGPSRTPIFSGGKIADFEVNETIMNDPNKVNAGSSGDSGDNDIALAIAALRDARMLANSTSTPSEYYSSAVSSLGAITQQAGLVAEGQTNAVQSLEAQRQSAIGVNLDEELAQLVESQRAYQAAARLFSVFDGLYDTLLQM
ncbi:MAG: flagellar hook-associated protein FlgK [Candidatus Eisenbacteria bacterium]|nr:flagellar hook-associated protein FlgK [Candidatus Eisenbacteria bacterium]MCC7144078.1 flagellar hook-associated protein FlgK [Candidatus Eisenbacteria bacterium]